MPNRSFPRNYRGAIALNNMGVALLERRAYRQAVATLKDAISAMKLVLRPSSSPERELMSSKNIEDKVERASKRLARPRSVCSARGVSIVPYETSNLHSASKNIWEQGLSTYFEFPAIRLEATHLSHVTDLESSIILYNFGVAHLCLCRVSKCSASSQLLDGALKLFTMAYSIAMKKKSTDTQTEYETRLLVAAVAVNYICKVQIEMGNHTDAQRSYREMVQLGYALEEFESIQMNFPTDSSAAAA